MGVSEHAALDSGGFGAHPRTPTRPWRLVFDGLVKAFKQWHRWQIGTIHEVGWIADGTTPGISITAAIPPIFEAYATWRTGHMRGAGVCRPCHGRAT
jgi:hypothetical protein